MAELTSNTLSGLTTALTIDQGGTGASTVAGIRSGLGLGVLRSTVLTANTTWTVPNGVTQAWFEVYGAGAGGGGGGGGANTSWVQLTASFYGAMARRSDGAVFVWGRNNYGQLGLGDTANRSTPTQLSGTWQFVSMGENSTMGIRSDGTLWAWGDNTNGQLGTNDMTNRSSPVASTSGTAGPWSVARAGPRVSAAIKTNGTLWTVGMGGDGALGDGTVTTRWYWAQVGSSTGWSDVQVNYDSTAGRQSTALYAWGQNWAGQCGQNVLGGTYATPQFIPGTWTQISGLNGWTYHGLKSDGTMWGWGYNWAGQIGDNNAGQLYPSGSEGQADVSSPKQIGASTWSRIESGRWHTTGLTTGGAVYMWGDNWKGQYGNNKAQYSGSPDGMYAFSPVLVSTWGTPITDVTLGVEDTYMIVSSSLKVAGNNDYGSVGDSTTIHRSSPTTIGSGLQGILGYGGNGQAGADGFYTAMGYPVTGGTAWTIVIGKGGTGGAAGVNGGAGNAGSGADDTKVINPSGTVVTVATSSFGGNGGQGYSYDALFNPAQYNTARSIAAGGSGYWFARVGSAGGAGGRGGAATGATAGTAGANGKVIILY